MNRQTYWKKWIKAALMRSVRTMAQTALAGAGTGAALGEVNWVLLFPALEFHWKLLAALAAGDAWLLALFALVAAGPIMERMSHNE